MGYNNLITHYTVRSKFIDSDLIAQHTPTKLRYIGQSIC